MTRIELGMDGIWISVKEYVQGDSEEEEFDYNVSYWLLVAGQNWEEKEKKGRSMYYCPLYIP